jgi:hypothetical protein
MCTRHPTSRPWTLDNLSIKAIVDVHLALSVEQDLEWSPAKAATDFLRVHGV